MQACTPLTSAEASNVHAAPALRPVRYVDAEQGVVWLEQDVSALSPRSARRDKKRAEDKGIEQQTHRPGQLDPSKGRGTGARRLVSTRPSGLKPATATGLRAVTRRDDVNNKAQHEDGGKCSVGALPATGGRAAALAVAISTALVAPVAATAVAAVYVREIVGGVLASMREWVSDCVTLYVSGMVAYQDGGLQGLVQWVQREWVCV